MSLLWIAWLSATTTAFAAGDDKPHYVALDAPARVKVSKVNTRSLTDDVEAARAALEEAAVDLGACSAGEGTRHKPLNPMVVEIRYRKSGGSKSSLMKYGTGDLAVDHCLLSTLQGLSPELRFSTPFRIQVWPPGPRDLDADPTPLWSYIHERRLDNGLRVLHIPRPGREPVMRLVVGAGSLDEEDGQQGIAHFVEHMAFRGVAGASDLVFTVDGGAAAAHGNAFTSFDATVYQLNSTEEEPTDTQLELVRRWLGGEVAFDPAEVEVERKVVIEEMRWRYADDDPRRFPLIYGDTRWGERPPIGTLETLQAFTPQQAEAFHRRWYRPDNATLIIVGGSSKDAILAQIEGSVGTIPRASEPLAPRSWRREHPAGDRGAIVGEPGTLAAVQIGAQLNIGAVADHEQLRRMQLTDFVGEMVVSRLTEAGEREDRLWGVDVGRSWAAPALLGLDLYVADMDDGAQGLELATAVHTELRRLAQHGFRQDELDQAVEEQVEALKSSLDRPSATSPTSQAEELVRHARYNEPIPGRGYEREMAESWLSTIDLETVDAFYRELFVDGPRVTRVDVDRPQGSLPPDQELVDLVEAAWAQDVEAQEAPEEEDWEDDPLKPMFIEDAAEIARRHAVAGTVFGGFVTDTGITVHVFPGSYHRGWMQVQLIGPGVGSARGQDRVDAVAAEALASVGGIPPKDGEAFDAWLRHRYARMHVEIGARRSTLTLQGSPYDFEALIAALRWAALSPSRPDRDALAERVAQRLDMQRERLTEEIVEDMSATLLGEVGPLPDNAAELVDPARAREVLSQVFDDPSQLTLIISGAVPMRDRREEPLLQALAEWPSDGRPIPTARSMPVVPNAPMLQRVAAGPPGKAELRIALHAPLPADDAAAVYELPILAALLRQHLIHRLRIDEGLFYTIDVDGDRVLGPNPRSVMTLAFTCDSQREGEARKLVARALESFPDHLDQQAVEAAVKTEQRRVSSSSRWFARTVAEVEPGRSMPSGKVHRAEFDALELDVASLRRAAVRYVVKSLPATVVATPDEPTAP